MLTVAQLFDTYRKRVIPPGASDVQVLECQRAFYAGSYSMLTSMLEAVGDEETSEDEGVAQLEKLKNEIEDFGARGGDLGPTVPDVNYTEPDPLEMQTTLKALGSRIGDALPAGWGFTLLLFSYGEGGSLFYISSADRADVISTMREFINRQTQ